MPLYNKMQSFMKTNKDVRFQKKNIFHAALKMAKRIV